MYASKKSQASCYFVFLGAEHLDIVALYLLSSPKNHFDLLLNNVITCDFCTELYQRLPCGSFKLTTNYTVFTHDVKILFSTDFLNAGVLRWIHLWWPRNHCREYQGEKHIYAITFLCVDFSMYRSCCAIKKCFNLNLNLLFISASKIRQPWLCRPWHRWSHGRFHPAHRLLQGKLHAYRWWERQVRPMTPFFQWW